MKIIKAAFKKLDVLLLRNIKNPIVRSAVINGALTVGVAAVDVLDAQLHSGHIDVNLIAGAATLAFSKWVHSTITTVVDNYTSSVK